MAYILGVDIGTSGTKTVLFSEDGTPVASATYEYPLYTPQNGYAEQEPLDWWNASVNGIKDVISQSNVSADDIKGVGLSGQMHGLVMLDAENQPIRKSIIWCDQRTAKEVAEITDKVGADRMIEITANPAITGFTAAMRIKQFAMCPFDAIATGVSTFCGQNLGAGKTDRIKKGILQGVFVGMAYGLVAGIVLIFFGRTLTLLFVKPSATAVLDASAKYLRCLGFFYWSLGILNTCRMTTQGLGYSGRAILSGAVEMAARCFVSLALVPIFHFDAICFADQSAWITATLYIVPTCLLVVRSIEKKRKECK